ncbi:homeobox protein Pknox1, putative, partial [Ixodes scapularis]|uniref:Homeobox protein Pknox1, putative n=2 Tax=Ixodes scapularis TaxID=6945 RepID=A0A1S4LAP7_IXOSC
ALCRHPLFPLLALLFEKCERATQSAEAPCSESFSSDIQAFVQHQEQDRKPFFSDDPEVDGLMVKAIQVLRIHLLELEKVQELCKDFCNRYIACLKNKMQSENLLRSADFPSSGAGGCDGGLSDSPSSSACSSPAPAPSPPPPHHPLVAPQVSGKESSSGDGRFCYLMPVLAWLFQSTCLSASTLSPGQVVSGGTVFQVCPIVLRCWLSSSSATQQHPYPTEDEKRQIAAQTNLTLLQVNNWFINARRRILQPMLDASNPESSQKAKKAKVQTVRPVERFWPDAIASLQPRASGHNGTGSAPSPG